MGERGVKSGDKGGINGEMEHCEEKEKEHGGVKEKKTEKEREMEMEIFALASQLNNLKQENAELRATCAYQDQGIKQAIAIRASEVEE